MSKNEKLPTQFMKSLQLHQTNFSLAASF